MRFALVFLVLAGLALFPPAGKGQSTRITSVDPLTAKAGDVVSAKGEGMDPANVDELYLTNGTDDIKVEMTQQTDKLIKFKVPSGVKAGRWALMVHLKSGSGPRLIEQPVKVTVE
jgi:hypothetical protein